MERIIVYCLIFEAQSISEHDSKRHGYMSLSFLRHPPNLNCIDIHLSSMAFSLNKRIFFLLLRNSVDLNSSYFTIQFNRLSTDHTCVFYLPGPGTSKIIEKLYITRFLFIFTSPDDVVFLNTTSSGEVKMMMQKKK